jgi:prepilin-type N-terminal cleavage/methylation domain-containing protein
MTAPERRARGYTLFELVVVIMVFAAIVALLLERLAYYHEVLERAAMEHGEPALKQLRFRVRLVRSPVQLPGGAVERTSGIALAPARPYSWP